MDNIPHIDLTKHDVQSAAPSTNDAIGASVQPPADDRIDYQPAQNVPISPQPNYYAPPVYAAPQNVRQTVPAPGYGNAYLSGSTNAYPVYSYEKTPKQLEREKLQKAASSGGAMSIAVTLTMVLVAIIIGVSSFMTGTFTLETGEGDPYMGFSPLGFYMYEGLASLLSIFIPALIIMHSVKKRDSLRFDDLLPFEKIGGKKLAAVVFGGMAICMIAQLMASLLSFNFAVFGFDVEAALDTTMGTTVFDIVMNSVCTALIPALVEEFAYRGVVLGTLKKYDTGIAIIGSAFLFGMVHGNLGQIPFAFVVGLVLAYVRVKCDSMLPNILIHFGNNFYAVILMTISEIASDEVSTLVDAAIMVILIIAGLISLYYISKTDKDFFKLEPHKSELTFGEKMKAFFSTGTVIVSSIILCIETIAVIELI